MMEVKPRSGALARLLTSEQAAERMGRSDRWLRNERRLHRGPAYIRWQGWQPLYDPDVVDAWIAEQLDEAQKLARR
jgi:hypothetical protein